MIGTSCASIAMMEWDEFQPHIDVLISSTIIILYACHAIMILCLHY